MAAWKKLELKELVPYYIAELLNPPEWIQLLDEDELKDEAKPDPILWQLRIRLWGMIEVVLMNQASGGSVDPIDQTDLYRDICTKNMFMSRIKNEVKGAFICRPIYDFQHQLDALLTVGTSKLWEIMTLPLMNKDKALDATAAKLILQAFKMLKDTKFGGPVQRVLTATLNDKNKDRGNKAPILVDEEIKLLEERLKAGKVVDVGEN